MGLNRFRAATLLTLTFLLLSQAPSYAGGLTLIEKLIYKEVYVMDPNGRETATLVNKLTDKVEYSWAVDKWIKAPSYLGQCYRSQRSIRSWVDGPGKNKR